MNGPVYILLTRLSVAVAVLVTVAFPFQARCACPTDGGYACVSPVADARPAQTEMKARHACCELERVEDEACCPDGTSSMRLCACSVSTSPHAVVAAHVQGVDGASRFHDFTDAESVILATGPESSVSVPSSYATSHSPPYVTHCALLC